MTKQDFIKELGDAKAAHVKWHAYAQALAMGVESGAEKLPQLYTDCSFGKWYYSTGHFLSFMNSFNEIEPLHIQLHKLYMEIYQKYLEPEKGGLFKSAEKIKKQKTKELNNLVAQLKEVSAILINKFTEVQTNISNMTEEELMRKLNA